MTNEQKNDRIDVERQKLNGLVLRIMKQAPFAGPVTLKDYIDQQDIYEAAVRAESDRWKAYFEKASAQVQPTRTTPEGEQLTCAICGAVGTECTSGAMRSAAPASPSPSVEQVLEAAGYAKAGDTLAACVKVLADDMAKLSELLAVANDKLAAVRAAAAPPGEGVMICEQHPELEWPHGDCAGPGCPLSAQTHLLWMQRRDALQERDVARTQAADASRHVLEIEAQSAAAVREALEGLKADLKANGWHYAEFDSDDVCELIDHRLASPRTVTGE